MKEQSVILFDGVCLLCNGAVDFIRQRDVDRSFQYLAIQSKEGEAFLEAHGKPKGLDTILLFKDDTFYDKSDAVLEICRSLPYWKVLIIFKVLPRFLRDGVYDLIAKYRYKIFGKSDECRIIE